MKEKDKTVFAFVFIGILIIFCAHVYFYSGTIIDEAYISFRYARNWAEGYGPVFNHGERVEGYTNFLTVVLLTIQYKLCPSVDPLSFVKAIGVFAALLQLFLGALILWHMALDTLLVFLFLACDGTFIFGALNGLETQMFALFVTAAIYFDLELEIKRSSSFTSTLFYFIAFLTRPDGVVFFALSRGIKFMGSMREHKKLPDDFMVAGVLFVVASAIYIFLKYLFYGSIVPNTFYAKTGYETSSRFTQGFFYFLLFVRDHPISSLLFLVLVPFFFQYRKSRFLFFIFLGFSAYLFCVGGDWLQGSRFFVPVLPVFYVLIAYGLSQFVNGGMNQLGDHDDEKKIPRLMFDERRFPVMQLFAAFCVTAVLCGQLYASKTTYTYAVEKTEGYKRAHIPLAIYLKNTLPQSATIALMDIGIVGFVTNMRIVDLMGLTDSYIARSSGGENFLKRVYPVGYIFSKHPDCIVLANAKEKGKLTGSFLIPMEEKIYASPDFKKNYWHAKTYFHRKNYYLHVYIKKREQATGNRVQ